MPIVETSEHMGQQEFAPFRWAIYDSPTDEELITIAHGFVESIWATNPSLMDDSAEVKRKFEHTVITHLQKIDSLRNRFPIGSVSLSVCYDKHSLGYDITINPMDNDKSDSLMKNAELQKERLSLIDSFRDDFKDSTSVIMTLGPGVVNGKILDQLGERTFLDLFRFKTGITHDYIGIFINFPQTSPAR